MADGGLRSFSSTKITFFVFLDIITAVTGIFIFIVLLLSFRLGENDSTTTGAAGGKAASDPVLEAKLADVLHKLEALVVKNHTRESALTEGATMPDAAALRRTVAELKAAIAAERAAGARLQTNKNNREAADAARDDAVGLTADRAQIQKMKEQLASLSAENAEKRKQSETLENDVKEAQARLLDEQNRRGNRLWLVPDSPSTTKEPVLVTVAGQKASIDRFNKPESHVVFDASNTEDDFRSFLKRCNKLNDYVVFCVRPSGVERFEIYLATARAAGFEVGYDAIEEDRDLVFSLPSK